MSALAVLRNRDFARFAAGRVCATLAWQMMGVAVGWQVYALTHDTLALGFVGLAQFLPFVALVLPAGQIADRADRRLVLAAAYGVEALSAITMLVFTWTGGRQIAIVYAAMALFGAGRAFWMPAAQAMTPNLVPPQDFPNAVAVNSGLFEAAVIIGPALGGLLYLFGPLAAYGLATLLLALVVLLMFGIRPVRAASATQAFRVRDVLEGLRFVLRQKVVLGAISLDLFSAAPPRCCRRTRRTCCTWGRSASACCAPRPASAPRSRRGCSQSVPSVVTSVAGCSVASPCSASPPSCSGSRGPTGYR
jgi:MFS family permease